MKMKAYNVQNSDKYRVHFNWDNGLIEIRTVNDECWIATFESESLAFIACDALNTANRARALAEVRQ